MLGGVLAFLFVGFGLGIPIFIVLSGALFVILGTTTHIPLIIIPQRMFDGVDAFALMAIPFFNLTAEIMRAGKLSDRLIRLARTLVGFLPGGLGIASVLACMLFASISGSSPATVIAAGSILLPALDAAGYDRRFSTGLIATAGSLGILIPPSITFVIYGVVTSTSIGALFSAGLLPGLLIGALLMTYCFVYGLRRKLISDPPPTRQRIISDLRGAGWVLGLPVLILGGIYGGIFTPTEAAAVSVFYAFFIAIAVHRTLAWREVPELLYRSGRISAALLILIAGATAFSWLITNSQIPQTLSQALFSTVESRWGILLVFNFILLVMGCFLEGASAIVILSPLIMPIMQAVGVDPIHLGVIFVLNMEIGMVTPPVGMNLMVTKLLTGSSLPEIVRSVVPFMLIMLVGLIIITYVPSISMSLPQLLFGN